MILKSSSDESEPSVSLSEPLTTSSPFSTTLLLLVVCEERGNDVNDEEAVAGLVSTTIMASLPTEELEGGLVSVLLCFGPLFGVGVGGELDAARIDAIA
jgi:hypothetical protein